MNQEELNSMRRMAGLAPSYDSAERKRLDERAAKYGGDTTILKEAANNRAPGALLAQIARQHFGIRTLKAQGHQHNLSENQWELIKTKAK